MKRNPGSGCGPLPAGQAAERNRQGGIDRLIFLPAGQAAERSSSNVPSRTKTLPAGQAAERLDVQPADLEGFTSPPDRRLREDRRGQAFHRRASPPDRRLREFAQAR